MKTSPERLRRPRPRVTGWLLLCLLGVPGPVVGMLWVLRDFISRKREQPEL